mgnify:CR=1 FL=1
MWQRAGSRVLGGYERAALEVGGYETSGAVPFTRDKFWALVRYLCSKAQEAREGPWALLLWDLCVLAYIRESGP